LALCLIIFGFWAWSINDPGCVCPSERVNLARISIESCKYWAYAISAILASFIFLIWWKLRSRALSIYLFAAVVAACLAWMLFGAFVELPLHKVHYAGYPVASLVPLELQETSAWLFAPLTTWRFLVSLSVFIAALLASILVIKRRRGTS